MQLRDHNAVTSKRDYFTVDPRLLKIEPNYNIRNLDSPDERPDLDELKESIRANGVKVPLEVRLSGEEVFVVAGHRRHKMVMELIAEGEDIKAVPVMPEPKNTNDADRILNLIISNSGKPLKPLEIAEVVRRLVAFGWDHGQIAKRIGWKSTASVLQHLDLLAMPEGVKKQVVNNDISATLAAKLVKETPNAEELIRANKEENKRLGVGKDHKVTVKTINRDKQKAKPKSDSTLEPEQTVPTRWRGTDAKEEMETVIYDSGRVTMETFALGNKQQAPAQETTDAVHAQPSPLVDTTSPALPGLPDGRIVELAVDLILALKPFAELANDHDLNAKDDSDLLEVFVRDVKRAWEVYARVVGDTQDEAA